MPKIPPKKAPRKAVAAKKPSKASPKTPKANKAARKPPRAVELTAPWLADSPEGRLCRAANGAGVSVDYLVQCNPEMYPQQIIERAKGLDRAWEASLRERVRKLGGTWNGVR